MAVADDLFQLIHSLTPSEKRYFKIHAKTHIGDKYKNSYEKLFDAMNYWPDDEVYDEKLFKRKHKGKTFLKNLSAEKNYLYELILGTMRAFHDNATIDREINDLLMDEDFLRKRRLNEQRKKVIDKAKKLARQYEKTPALLTLIEREINMHIEWSQSQLKDFSETMGEEEVSILAGLNVFSRVRHLSNKLFIKLRINTAQVSQELQSDSAQIIKDDVVKNYKPGSSFWGDYHYLRIHALHYRIHRNMHEHMNYCNRMYELFEQNTQQKKSNPSSYKIALFNYLNACFAAGNLKPFPELLQKASSLPCNNRDEEGEDWQNLIHLKLIYLVNTGALHEATSLADDINKGIKNYKDKINNARRLAIYYNLGTAFFVSGQWADALDHYSLVAADKTDARRDIKEASELLLLIIQYELKNYDLVDYHIRNTERRLKNETSLKTLKSLGKLLKLLMTGKRNEAIQSSSEADYGTYQEIQFWHKALLKNEPIKKLFLREAAVAV